MGAPQYEQAGADIAGTGTVNYLAKWTAGSTLGNSVIYDNGTNVGIGTASPAYKLDVNGTLNAQQPISIQSGNQGVITWNGGAANFLNILASSGKGFSVGTNGVYDRLMVDTSGNVGIGTTNTSTYKLTVNGTVAVWDGTNGRVALTPSGSANTGYVDWRNGTGTRLGYMGGGSSTNVNLTLENSANFTIDGGNVGIGTASPARKVEINSAAPLRMGTGGEYFDFIQQGVGTWALLSSAGQYVTAWKLSGGVGFGGVVAPATNTVDISTSAWGLKLPATPGNADTQTLDCYAENTWTATDGSGAGLTFTVNNTAVYTRAGRLVHARIDITFPATANASNALINLPFNAIVYGASTSAFVSGIGVCLLLANGAAFEVYNSAGSRLTNANLSGARIVASAVYQAA